MAIVAGQFSSIGDDFNIKVQEKYGDRDQYLKGVIIHKKILESPSENTTCYYGRVWRIGQRIRLEHPVFDFKKWKLLRRHLAQ